jgi:hypothetical protein
MIRNADWYIVKRAVAAAAAEIFQRLRFQEREMRM